jgi:PST family polysaccharide transporter
MVDRVVRMGFGLVVGVWVARYLGPSRFGLLNYSQALVALLTVFGTLGLERVVVRDLVREPEHRGEILATALVLRTAGGMAAWAASIGLAVLLNPHEPATWGLVAILGGGIFVQSSDVIDYWFQSRVESKYSVIARNGAFLATAGLRVVLILLRASLVWFAVAMTVEMVLAAVGLTAIYLHRKQTFADWRPNGHRMAGLLRDAWPLVLSGMAVMIYMRIDQLMLQSMSGPASVGIYSATVRISEVWYFVPVAVVSSAMPNIVEGKRLGQEIYVSRNMKLFRALVVMSLTVSVLLSLVGSWVVVRLYGPAYAEAGPILAVHAWTSIFVALSISQGPWMVAEGYTMMALRRSASGAALNLVLNFLFLRKYGCMAAALNTLAAQAFAAIFVNSFTARSRPIFRMQMRALVFWRA